tara:strand:- start:1609 stop:2706 length:1098 start_codon:yes stop_codon:yes gene_type:complete
MNFKEIGLPEYLEYHEMVEHSPKWHAFRLNGIGGSEIGSCLKVSDFKPSIQLYYEKAGIIDAPHIKNEAVFHGTHLESYVGECWKHWWDGEYMDNYNNGKLIRDYFKPSGYITNPKYPHLFASVDGIIPMGQKKMFGETLDKPGGLEIKNMSKMAIDKWETSIPPYYMLQMQMYMLVLEIDYFEIAILKDGRYLSVQYVLREDEMCDTIAKVSKDFWENRVVPAKIAQKKSDESLLNNDDKAYSNYQDVISRLEPEVDDSKSYAKFLKDRHQKVDEVKEGDMEDWNYASHYAFWANMEKTSKKNKTYAGSTIRKVMERQGVDKWTFDEDGYFNIYVTKDNSNRVNNKIKYDFDSKKIYNILKKEI